MITTRMDMGPIAIPVLIVTTKMRPLIRRAAKGKSAEIMAAVSVVVNVKRPPMQQVSVLRGSALNPAWTVITNAAGNVSKTTMSIIVERVANLV